MTTQKLILEISESLLQQLEHLADATDQSPESLIVNCITRCLPQVAEEVSKLEKLLEGVTSDNLHNEVDFGEPVGREFH